MLKRLCGAPLRLAGAVVFSALALLSSCSQERGVPESGYRDWRVYGGWDQIRYSALEQIRRENVDQLEVAWTYDTGDAFEGSEMQCNPIVIDGTLYATSPSLRLIALDAATGEERWTFDPTGGEGVTGKARNRGLNYWEDSGGGRIFFAARQYLWAIDAATGKPVESFGSGGRIDLREGLGRDPRTLSVSLTTPGAVYKDLLIIGSIVPEALPAAPGDIRAYDVRTGELRWSFHTIPRPGEFGYETWPEDGWKYLGGANNWSGMSLDVERGIVFVPTGSATFDFYGGNRPGDNLFANTLLALDAETGERLWHFQFVKHDVWDRDLPAPPSLVTVKRDGRLIDAAAQITKSGHVFVFERETGEPLFPIEWRDVPPSPVEGEVLADKQLLPAKPPAFARQIFTREMITRRTAEAHAAVFERFEKLRSGPQFTAPSHEGTIIFPGYDGGGEWGGAAFDPATGLLYVNSNEMAWILRIIERPDAGERPSGKDLYRAHCASCHQEDFSGTPPEFPSLIELGDRMSISEVRSLCYAGKGRMPGFSHLGRAAIQAVSEYALLKEDTEAVAAQKSKYPIQQKYTFDGYNKFLDPDGYPAVEPPWGTLNAINLDTGEIAWKRPFGEIPELAEQGLTNTGSENYGGGVVTAGGLLFIGATNFDNKFHAFDKLTGELLWEAALPAAGNATPAVYEADGRQFVVIGAGGGKWGNPSGGSYVAFALPQE